MNLSWCIPTIKRSRLGVAPSVACLVYWDSRDYLEIDYDRLCTMKILADADPLWILPRVGLDRKILLLSRKAHAMRKTEWIARESHFQRFFVRSCILRQSPSKFCPGDDPRRRDAAGSQVTSSTSPWTRLSAGCYVSSLKNIKARDMLMKSTSITSCCRENQSWKRDGTLHVISVFLRSHARLGIGAKNSARPRMIHADLHKRNCDFARDIVIVSVIHIINRKRTIWRMYNLSFDECCMRGKFSQDYYFYSFHRFFCL